MEQAIIVTPVSYGWKVRCSARKARDALFLSGAQAEAAAHCLGAEIAEAGDTAVIEIFLRSGALGARYVHAPNAGSPTPQARAAAAPSPRSPAAK